MPLRLSTTIFVTLLAALAAGSNAKEKNTMFTQAEFMQLKFLEGRWMGTGPDGKPFYEEYDFPDAATMRSRRFPDAAFGTANDGSTVSFKDGEIMSRWGEFTWRADEVSAGKVCFAPVNAPSSFCWRMVDASLSEVEQRWTDADGKQQKMTMPLKRIAPAK